jgi:hypothetical protein
VNEFHVQYFSIVLLGSRDPSNSVHKLLVFGTLTCKLGTQPFVFSLLVQTTLNALGEMFKEARCIMSWLGDCAKVRLQA